MNRYVRNLNRLEFMITFACTGNCKHCSQGGHSGTGEHMDAEAAAWAVYGAAGKYNITSVMAFGGEPLLYPETVYAIHSAAKAMNIPKRQIITNGFFSKDKEKIKAVAERLVQCGANEFLLSADAFHQETIPLAPVMEFAAQVSRFNVRLRVHPAWLVSKEDSNPYNSRTNGIMAEFEAMGVAQSDGNIIFPSGNARKYLSEYYDAEQEYPNPYEQNPEDLQAICIEPDGAVLGGNIYRADILDILEGYEPMPYT